MKSDELLLLVHSTGADTTQLLHVGTDTEEKTQVHAERSDVGTSLAADPENTEVTVVVELNELALVDGTDTELTLDGGDQRGTLEEGTGEGLEGAGELGLAAGDLVMQTDNADILLSGTLLGLDEAGSTVNADDEATSNLRIKGTAVAGLLATKDGISNCQWANKVRRSLNVPENSLDPSDDLVTGRVGGLVKVNDT